MGKLIVGVNDLATVRPDIAKEWNYERNGNLKPDMVMYGSSKRVWWKCEMEHEWKVGIRDRVRYNTKCPFCSNKKVLKGFNDLATLRPDIAKEWNYERNGDLKPNIVTPHSNKKVWWRCSKHPEHEWEVSINSRTNMNSGCPICAGQRVLKGFNDLETLRPDIAKEWNYGRNGDLKPDMVTCGTRKKVWWRCSKHPEHEWESSIVDRTSKGCGCPICSGHQVLAGYNDLATLRPDISKEWNYERNGDLTPEMVALGSNKKIWWKCEKGHEWKVSINSRTSMGNACPICSGHQVLAGYNDLETLRPDIAKEWNYEKNGNLTPEMVTCNSGKKVWWRCSKHPEHEWESIVSNRTSAGNGCPICAGQKVLKGFNDLATLRPDIAKEWNYERNGNLTPEMVTCGSNKKVWWICEKGHEWKSRVSSRKKGTGCPICLGRQVLKGFNDLKTLRPDLAAEWHPTKNGELKPDMVTCGSQRKVWWRCSKHPEHEWEVSINSRTNMNSGCPICAKERMVSFPEKIIAYYLKKVLPIRENIFIDRWNVDILYNNVVIEYDGEYFHSQCVDKDELKNKDLNGLGFTVIRILGRGKSDYIKLSNTRYEIYERNYDHFKQLISDLCTYLKVSCPDVDVERDKEKIKELLD